MSVVVAILAGWFALSIVVGIAFGRAARLGSGQTGLSGGPSDPARPVPQATVGSTPQPRHHSGPAAA